MKSSTRILLTIAACLIGCGILFGVIGVCTGASNQVYIDHTGLHVNDKAKDINVEEKLEAFHNLDIDVSFTNVKIVYSDHFGIVIKGRSTYQPSYEIENDTLILNSRKPKSFSIFSFSFWEDTQLEVTIYLPEKTNLKDIVVDSSFGEIDFLGGTVETMKVNASFGKANFQINVTDQLTIDNSFGELSFKGDIKEIKLDASFGTVSFELEKPQSNYEFKIDTSFGSVDIDDKEYGSSTFGSGDLIRIDNSFGDIEFEFKNK